MLSYRIDRQRRLVLVTASGSIAVAEIMGYQDRLRADPDFEPTYSLLADCSSVTLADLDAPGMRRIVANVPFHPSARRAIVVRNLADYGIIRIYQALTELGNRGEVQPFHDIDAALAWIDTPFEES